MSHTRIFTGSYLTISFARAIFRARTVVSNSVYVCYAKPKTFSRLKRGKKPVAKSQWQKLAKKLVLARCVDAQITQKSNSQEMKHVRISAVEKKTSLTNTAASHRSDPGP